LLARDKYTIEDGITQSLLGKWVHCRTAVRRYLDGWRRGHDTESITYGSMFHTGLELLYCGVRGGTVRRPADALGIPAVVARKRKTGRESPEAAQREQLCMAQMAAVWPAYLEYYESDLRKGTWLELEGLFDARWRGFRLRGRRDGVLRVNRKLWLFETKTKSRISEQEIEDALGFDFQSLFYITANEAELEARKARTKRLQGVRYNVIRKPQHKLGKAETLPQYSARIAEDIAKDRGRWFMRYEAAYTRRQVEEFQTQLEDKLNEFARWLRGAMPTYRDELSCRGRYNCEYLAACGQGSMVGYDQDGVLFSELED
jgi:hypothetical protein